MPEILHTLHGLCFSSPWSSASFAALLAQPSTRLIIRDRHAFGLFQWVDQELEVLTLAVAPDWRRQGVALGIMQQAETMEARRIFLEVGQHNTAAIALYQSLGYTQIGVRKGYYADGEDALRMEKRCG